MRPELELVICCLRVRVNEAQAQRIRTLLRGELDWPEVLATAAEHRVGPRVWETLRAEGEERVPPEALAMLRERARGIAAGNLSSFAAMVKVCQRFEADHIPLVPYRGLVLSRLIYGNPTRRSFAGLDFCLDHRHLRRGAEILHSLGYGARFDIDAATSARRNIAPGPYLFVSASSALRIDLHSDRTFLALSPAVRLDDLTERLSSVGIWGRIFPTFSVEDTLMLSCIRGTAYFWRRLCWVAEVSDLVATGRVDWAVATRLVERNNCRRMLLLGLSLAHEWMGAPVPDHLVELAQRDRSVRWLVREQRKQLAGPAQLGTAGISRAIFVLRSQDGWKEQLRSVLGSGGAATGINRDAAPGPPASSRGALVRSCQEAWRRVARLRRRPVLDLAGFLPMRPEVVDDLLSFVGVSPDDVLYDLGCGDGRIVVAAAEKFGVRAVGVDVNPRRIAEATALAKKRGVHNRVRFLLQDAKKVDLSEATIVTMYLTQEGTLRLANSLKQRLSPGARVASCGSEFYGWPWDRSADHRSATGEVTPMYLWRVGDRVPNRADTES